MFASFQRDVFSFQNAPNFPENAKMFQSLSFSFHAIEVQFLYKLVQKIVNVAVVS